MSQRMTSINETLSRLETAAARVGRHINLMEVCGTHTVNAFRSGLHSLTPANVTLLSGPGCPVCVTSQGDIDQLIELALRPGITLCTYGDMMRVTGAKGSLAEARGQGADVRVIYSALDAVKLAASDSQRKVVFAAVGFETTAPATAVAILEADRLRLLNFTALTSHKTVLPAMLALLESGAVNVDGFLCPGHASIIVGSDAFVPVVERFGIGCAVAGFEANQIAAGMAALVEMVADNRPALVNLYPQAVSPKGNSTALRIIEQIFEPFTAWWRGIGELPESGLRIRPRFARYDARVRYELTPAQNREPAGCKCGDVITGKLTPADCKLFGVACTPARPVGPCMVSSEGTCQAWFKYRREGKGIRVPGSARAREVA